MNSDGNVKLSIVTRLNELTGKPEAKQIKVEGCPQAALEAVEALQRELYEAKFEANYLIEILMTPYRTRGKIQGSVRVFHRKNILAPDDQLVWCPQGHLIHPDNMHSTFVFCPKCKEGIGTQYKMLEAKEALHFPGILYEDFSDFLARLIMECDQYADLSITHFKHNIAEFKTKDSRQEKEKAYLKATKDVCHLVYKAEDIVKDSLASAGLSSTILKYLKNS